jgi:hypothetical protein
MAASVAPAVALAHSHRLRLRLTEFNSVTCGGRDGVSNTFATALWAPDALFQLLRVGVDGVNLHLRGRGYNVPFRIKGDRFIARPLLYGLVMFVRTLGPQARITPLAVGPGLRPGIDAWGVVVRRRYLHVLVIDKTANAARLTLRVPGATRPAGVERLQAPSARAEHRVTLAGQQLSRDGRWVGQREVQMVAPARGAYGLTVPGFSEALVSVPLRG